MGNVIHRNTKVIKATFKVDSLKYLGTLVCTKSEREGGWVAPDNEGRWHFIFTSYLRNSDVCDIECFDSWDAYHAKETSLIA